MKKSEKIEVKMQARPFVKWVGGKRQLVPELVARVPGSWDRERDLYAEPFVGSGALYFALRPRRAVLSDMNADLVSCWTALRNDHEGVVRQLRVLQRRYVLSPEETYYDVRSWDPDGITTTTRAARLIFLNKAGFNGLYRVNREGKFNSPWGRNPKVTILDEENLARCSELLRSGDVSVREGDFASAKSFPPGTLVYFDPPYVPRSRTADFGAFTKVKFSRQDHERLARYAARLSSEGCHVLVSESDDEEVAELFTSRGFTRDAVSAVRMVNSSGHARGPIVEHIFKRTAGLLLGAGDPLAP